MGGSMQITVVRDGTLAMAISDAIAVYVVRVNTTGTQSVVRVVKNHGADVQKAVKQIAIRAAQDAHMTTPDATTQQEG